MTEQPAELATLRAAYEAAIAETTEAIFLFKRGFGGQGRAETACEREMQAGRAFLAAYQAGAREVATP